MVQRAVSDGSQEIRSERDVGIQDMSASPQLEHDLLRDLLGGIHVMEKGRGDADESRIPGAEDRVVRSFVATLDLQQERAVVHGWRS
jgi:hypothetical protein